MKGCHFQRFVFIISYSKKEQMVCLRSIWNSLIGRLRVLQYCALIIPNCPSPQISNPRNSTKKITGKKHDQF